MAVKMSKMSKMSKISGAPGIGSAVGERDLTGREL
jgi:hypothetical protein